MQTVALMEDTVPTAHGLHAPGPAVALNVFAGQAEHCSLLVSYPGAHMQEDGGVPGTLEAIHWVGLFTCTISMLVVEALLGMTLIALYVFRYSKSGPCHLLKLS
jgi:hypothetical protein